MFLAHDQLFNQATPDHVNYDSHDQLINQATPDHVNYDCVNYKLVMCHEHN